MTRASIEEVAVTVRPRYLQGDRAVKRRVLDGLVAITGYHRKACYADSLGRMPRKP
jgi:hypothetical protein